MSSRNNHYKYQNKSYKYCCYSNVFFIFCAKLLYIIQCFLVKKVLHVIPPLTQHIKIKVCDRRESNAHSPESESGILSIKLRSQKSYQLFISHLLLFFNVTFYLLKPFSFYYSLFPINVLFPYYNFLCMLL